MFRAATRLLLLLPALVLVSDTLVFAQADERVIYASVVDKDGEPVAGLTEKDFVVREDGQAREILRVAKDNDPLRIALLVDNSHAMRNQVADLRKAVIAFIDNTREGVQIALITLAERPTIAVAYTADHAALKKAANGIFAIESSGNYLLDGIAETSQGLLTRSTVRTVIVAITSAADLSYRQYPEVLRFFREGGASLHVLTLGMASGDADREIVVGRATDETGGRNEIVLASMGLEPKSKQLATEVSNQYRVIYARPQRLIPPKSTEISSKRNDVRTRGMLVKTDKERQ